MAEVCGLIPDPWQHETIAYGEYANVVRGRRKPQAARELEIVNPRASFVRKAWRDLIKHIYEVDPLICRCGQEMKIVSIIDQPDVIERILRHLGMWPPPKRPPRPRAARRGPHDHPEPRAQPRSSIPRPHEPCYDDCQIPPWDEEDFSQVPEGWDD